MEFKKFSTNELRKMPKKNKKILTFFLTTDEALEFYYMVQQKSKKIQEYLRGLVIKDLKDYNN